MSEKYSLKGAPQGQTTKRIVISDRFALITRNWQKHRVPTPGYYNGPGPGRKKPDNNRDSVAAQ